MIQRTPPVPSNGLGDLPTTPRVLSLWSSAPSWFRTTQPEPSTSTATSLVAQDLSRPSAVLSSQEVASPSRTRLQSQPSHLASHSPSPLARPTPPIAPASTPGSLERPLPHRSPPSPTTPDCHQDGQCRIVERLCLPAPLLLVRLFFPCSSAHPLSTTVANKLPDVPSRFLYGLASACAFGFAWRF